MTIPIKKRLFPTGRSFAVVIPFEWLEYHRQKLGDFKYVMLELSEDLIVRPCVEEKKQEDANDAANPVTNSD